MEVGDLQKLHERYSKQGLVVIGVAMDPKPEPVKKMAKDKKLGYILIAAGKDIFKAYGIGVPPGIVLIDKRGIVQVFHAPFAQMSPEAYGNAS